MNWATVRRWCRSLIGWRDCPLCNQQTLEWHKAWVVDPDEPPLFGWWDCDNCGAHTEILPTVVTEKAVRSLGYADFNDYAERNLNVTPRHRPDSPPQ